MFPKSAAGFSTFCHVCVVFKTHGRATSDTKCVLIFVILVSLGRTRGRQVTLEMRAETLRDFVLFPRCRSILNAQANFVKQPCGHTERVTFSKRPLRAPAKN